jgi:hypothetical protein
MLPDSVSSRLSTGGEDAADGEDADAEEVNDVTNRRLSFG